MAALPGTRDRSPVVSVVMSVYNGERFLREAVESVLAQTLPNFELLVVDDGSTDSSPEILSSYQARDPRIVVHRQSNQGRAAALNRGFAVAQAPLVARLDADDIAFPERLARQARFLEEHETVAVVGGAVTFIDDRGRAFGAWQYPLTDREIRKAFAHTTPLVHPAVMLRKEVFDVVGGYRTLFKEAEDIDLWLRIAEQHELANVPEEAICYRIHGGQATRRALEQQSLEAIAARASARARMGGRGDPLDEAERIDYQTALAIGATPDEIASAFVRDFTWLAKTMSRAGYANAAEELFARAADKARSELGSSSLVAHVHRERARRYREERRRVRATLETVRTTRAEWAYRAASARDLVSRNILRR
jgi:glycosyltransferase involved in cell wall biosynthesis